MQAHDTTLCIIVGAYFHLILCIQPTENTAPTPYNYTTHTCNNIVHTVLCHRTGWPIFMTITRVTKEASKITLMGYSPRLLETSSLL